MVAITQAPAGWDASSVTLYQANDAVLGNLPVLIFYGPSTTTNSTLNSSRIQAHIFSVSGLRSYPRLTVSPTSSLYAAVQHLPEEKQGDETSRGLAISLFKYFGELAPQLRQYLADKAAVTTNSSAFDAAHAARLVNNLVQSKDVARVTSQLMAAMAEKHINWVDMDVMVSLDAARQLKARAFPSESEPRQSVTDKESGPLMELLGALGAPAFLPTSKLRRAPSRPTGVSKTKSLSPAEVEALQREMMEATETEVAYVKKLQELDQLFSAADRQPDAGATQWYSEAHQQQQSLVQLLVRTLREISRVNGEFLGAIVDLMDETSSHTNYGQPNAATPGRHDITGAEAFAKVLLAFLPKFTSPYQQYMKLSPQIAHIVSASTELGHSTITYAIAQVGEKRLKSWLIEPVQRLPRYTLFVDKMIGLLPSLHPAVNKFLRAKDLIADICALDSEEVDTEGMVLRRLQGLVSQWPPNLLSAGRLLTAVDAFELEPPFCSVSSDGQGATCIILLLAGIIIVLRKCSGSTLTARGLLAELQRSHQVPSMFESENNTIGLQQQLVFEISFSTEDVALTESEHGRDIFFAARRHTLLGVEQHLGTDRSIATKGYCLHGAYEGRAAKLAEEISRARIESRFPEAIRDMPTWNFHISPPEYGRIGLAIAVFAPDMPLDGKMSARGNGTVVIDARDLKEGFPRAGQKTIYEPTKVDLRVSTLNSETLRLHGTTADGRRFIDQAAAADLLPLVFKRVCESVSQGAQPMTTDSVEHVIAFNQKVLEGVRPGRRSNSTSSRIKLRPISPVKALSTILGSGVKLSQYLTSQADNEPLPSPTPAPRPTSFQRKPEGDEMARGKFTVVSSIDAPASGSMLQLETTFNTYIVALHCRAGNIVGRSLRNRESADELMVNELYNTLIEDPSQHQAAAEVPVDILFAAFEKFVAHEWKDRMGEILPLRLLEAMQSTFDRTAPSGLAQKIKALLSEMSPQNRRVLAATVGLLYDLLEASGNDADRGSLTASFAEALVLDGDPHHFISLLDRLVDDVDTFFEDTPQIGVPLPCPSTNPTGSSDRTHFGNTGSMSSTGSSLKKRFGFGMLSREPSKNESESRMGNVWRTLSKKSSTDADSTGTGSVMNFLHRSKSSERLAIQATGSRPGSAHSAMSIQNSPQSAFSSIKGTTPAAKFQGEGPSLVTPMRRQKRRSSLSDLVDLERCASPFDGNSPIPKRTPQRQKLPQIKRFEPDPVDTNKPGALSMPAETRKKDNIGPRSTSPGMENKKALQTGEATRSLLHQREEGVSRNIRMPLVERTMFNENRPEPPTRTTSASGKMLMMKSHTPLKIRERIDKEVDVAQSTGAQLQAKMVELRKDLQVLGDTRSNVLEKQRFEEKLSALERKIAESQQDNQQRIASIRQDLESSLVVSEQKSKKLDKVYQAAQVENELLYDRFNTELAKVFQSVRVEGAEVVAAKLRESQLEVARLKKENFRLKRENIGFQSQLSG